MKGKQYQSVRITAAARRQNTLAKKKPLRINGPTFSLAPDPFSSAVITVIADRLTKKKAMVKNNKLSVSPTDATAAEEIQPVETMATVAKLKSLAKVKTSGQPICRSLAASFKRSLAIVYSSCFFSIARCELARIGHDSAIRLTLQKVRVMVPKIYCLVPI